MISALKQETFRTGHDRIENVIVNAPENSVSLRDNTGVIRHAVKTLWSKLNINLTVQQLSLNVCTASLACFKVSTNERCHEVGANIFTTFAPTLRQRRYNIGARAEY